MYGYLIADSSLQPFPFVQTGVNIIERSVQVAGYFIKQTTLDKFANDKIFVDTPQYFLSTEGVILNTAELQEQTHENDLAKLLIALYEKRGEQFFYCLRGSFSGVFYDKQKSLLLVFTDQQGSKMIFYTTNEQFCISSSLPWLVKQTQNKQLNEAGVLELLSWGYQPSCQTIVEGVKRLEAGNYLRIKNGKIEELTYHRFRSNHTKRTETDLLEQMNNLFVQAVKRVLQKNQEYSLNNYVPLSGGLDSRMIAWVANQHATNPIKCFTYSQSKMNDELLAREVAHKLGVEWNFIKLDGGDFLKRIDPSVRFTDMQINFAGPSESYNALLQLPYNQTGVIMPGIGGDNVFQSLYHRNYKHYSYGDYNLANHTYKELSALAPKDYEHKYADRTIHTIYARNFYCHNLGAPLLFQSQTESYSVYMDVDLMEFMLTVPEKLKKDYQLFDKWILTYYPEAATVLHNGHKIGDREKTIEVFYRSVPLRKFPVYATCFILRKLGINVTPKADLSKSPNPTQEWLQTNPSLLQAWNDCYSENKKYLAPYPLLDKYVSQQYEQDGNLQLKMHALTVLSAAKQLAEL